MVKTMKAWSLHGVCDLRYEDVPVPVPGENEVLIRVGACGICSSDVPRIFEKGTYHFPTIPGHEFAGLVTDAGGTIGKPWVGKRVGVFPLIPCKICTQCRQHHYEMCENYDYLGSRCDGGFAEYVKVPVWNLIELPDGISWDEAALLEPAAVALHAAKAAIEGRDSHNVSALVSGSGAIGFLVALWLQLLGCAEVVVQGRSAEKAALAESLQVGYLSSENPTSSCDYDIALEAVGSVDSVRTCLQSVKPGGRVVLLGNPKGDMGLQQDVYWSVLRKQLDLRGVWNSYYESGAPSEWTEVVKCISSAANDIDPLITHRFCLADLHKGLDIMRCSEPYGRILVFAR